jgi:hypothetical protein
MRLAQPSKLPGVFTIQAGIIWLNVGFLNHTVFHDEGISLAPMTSEDSTAVKGQVQAVRKGKCRISNESNLTENV